MAQSDFRIADGRRRRIPERPYLVLANYLVPYLVRLGSVGHWVAKTWEGWRKHGKLEEPGWMEMFISADLIYPL